MPLFGGGISDPGDHWQRATAKTLAAAVGETFNRSPRIRRENMDKDRIAGSTKIIKGKFKGAVGKAVGDVKLESDGKTDEIRGKVQNAVGGLKDSLKGK